MFRGCIERIGAKRGLRYVVLFGSRARGYAGPHSDFDVAVKVGRELRFVERGLLQVEFEECLGSRVDLVIVDDWDPIVVWEALSKGVLVYSCGDECLKEFYEDVARAIDEVADLEPLIKLFREEMRNALPRLVARVSRARRSLERLKKLAAMP